MTTVLFQLTGSRLVVWYTILMLDAEYWFILCNNTCRNAFFEQRDMFQCDMFQVPMPKIIFSNTHQNWMFIKVMRHIIIYTSATTFPEKPMPIWLLPSTISFLYVWIENGWILYVLFMQHSGSNSVWWCYTLLYNMPEYCINCWIIFVWGEYVIVSTGFAK